MAIKFGDANGEAKRGSSWYKIKDGENKMRLVGDIVARYVYWKKNKEGNNLSIECLSFDRDAEKFTNIEKDWFRDYFSEKKMVEGKEKYKDNCQWSYVVQVIDPTDGEVKPFGLKKKLFEQIMSAAKRLGDPTDVVNGWDVVFTKKKTGPLAYNVEYTLEVLDCKKEALTGERLEAAKAAKSIDEVVPRPTSDEVKKFMETNYNTTTVKTEKSFVPSDVNDDFNTDIPF